MHNVVVRSLVLFVVSTVIVLVSAFVQSPTDPAVTSVASQNGRAGHEMDTGMDSAPENEAAFISGMIPHHQEAVESAEAVLETTERAQVRKLAEAVIATQTDEIATLTGWLGRWYPDAAEADYAPMMKDPEAAGSDASDRAFLTGMVAHHQGAIDMAQAYLDSDFAKHPEVVQLAEAVVAVQDGEIEQMQGWLKAWYGNAGAGDMVH